MVEYWEKIAPYYDIGEEEEETKKQRVIPDPESGVITQFL